MRRSAGKFAATLAAALIAGALFSSASMASVTAPERYAKAGKIEFCTELAYPPWESINAETQKPEGFDIDLAAALAKQMGLSAEHKNIAFDGLIPALQAGQCDAIISGLADKPKRREVVDFADYAVGGNSIITRADSKATFKSLADLSGQKVSVAVGSVLEDELKLASEALKGAGKPPITIVSLQGGTDAFQQLAAGLADAYLGATDQASYFNKQRPGLVRLASPPLLALMVGVATLHKDKDLHDSLDAALKELEASGEYKAILGKWGLEAISIQQ
jgi:polar amino acid transport system substrate-binding protein